MNFRLDISYVLLPDLILQPERIEVFNNCTPEQNGGNFRQLNIDLDLGLDSLRFVLAKTHGDSSGKLAVPTLLFGIGERAAML